ncbi:hypothetical protein [Neorhizobium sp. SHOUNA12B]|uniref:hypothetical protein n=1 Tax=Neorhizobium sp. SHOUNA12B TaxID=2908928 RepID=UPI0025F562BF|nr:hypothetical protein [Neorhizobium sp. SHOUNA12B]MCJ9671451.1 hypothetical protein [Neorhizobium sp. SHOUNA12B]
MDQAELFFPQPMPRAPVDLARQDATDDDAPFRFEEVEPEPRVAYLVRLSDYPHLALADSTSSLRKNLSSESLAIQLS